MGSPGSEIAIGQCFDPTPEPTRRGGSAHTMLAHQPSIFLKGLGSSRLILAREGPGAMAQLVARFHGMEEVGGSNPPSSTECPESRHRFHGIATQDFFRRFAWAVNGVATHGRVVGP